MMVPEPEVAESMNPDRDVQGVLEALMRQGAEVGLQVAVYYKGEQVVDAWAGVADEASRRPVDAETLFNMSSCGKGVAATCLHMLADRDVVRYATPVADYWPEFGAHGKGGITVAHVLSHRSGIPHTPPGYGPAMLVDWTAMCDAIANLEPEFEPGSKTAYQAVNYGFIVGEIIRRVDGRSIGTFLQDEIARPLGAPSLYFGVPRSEIGRVATIRDAEPGARRGDTPPPTVSGATFNRDDVRQAAIPSSGGIVNARSLARHYAALAQGGALDGVRLLSPERVRAAAELQTDQVDELYHAAIKRSLGYRLGDDTGPGAGPSAFGHVGNGMFAYADPERELAVALLRNSFAAPPRGTPTAGEQVMAVVKAQLG
jgi:CubicO group peptidase (beta-lactamase class C family)